MEPLCTFHFAPEIEQSMVSMCFYAPERIAVLKRELDPQVHFTRPELRHILEAIELAYGERGESDFASVITTLRELGHLADCGGARGVNQVFEEYRYGFSSPQAQEEIFDHYIDMLKRYAVARAANSKLLFFNRGDLVLAPNKAKGSPRSPDYTGNGKVAGKPYSATAYQSKDGNLCVSLLPK
jgi:DnaB-like helicase N terminal domain